MLWLLAEWGFIYLLRCLGINDMLTFTRLTVAYPDPPYKKPKEDYFAYFEDMYRFTKAHLDKILLRQKSGYSFLELIEMTIQDNEKLLPLLQQADMIVFTHASYEYNSNYSHVGPMIAEKYHLHANMLDVVEEGDLSFVTALHVISAYFSQCKIKHAVIIALQQRALPLRYTENIKLPEYNCVKLISLTCISRVFTRDLTRGGGF